MGDLSDIMSSSQEIIYLYPICEIFSKIFLYICSIFLKEEVFAWIWKWKDIKKKLKIITYSTNISYIDVVR